MKNTQTFRVEKIDIETPDTKTFHLKSMENEVVSYQSMSFVLYNRCVSMFLSSKKQALYRFLPR